MAIPAHLIQIAENLRNQLRTLTFAPPVTHVYNPLEYAGAAHRQYLEKYGSTPKGIILLGMNPGPWGMAQTGVPFGEINMVRDWLKIDAPIGRPINEHPKRPVMGLACQRREVSGARLWGWARAAFRTPEEFFARFFVANYCPLMFMEQSGRNRTPDKLPIGERAPLLDTCDRALRLTVECLQPKYVIGVGIFAEARARIALQGMNLTIGRIPHPSPASPAANRGWAEQTNAALETIGCNSIRRLSASD